MAFARGDGTGHRYRATCAWSGSTGLGYDHYDRTHHASSTPADATLELSNDPSLGGRAELLDPEQLLLMSAASCQLLSFLAVAARARIDVRDYRDEAEARTSTDERPVRLAEIVLRPTIVVGPGPSAARVGHLVEVAHRECHIANSLSTPVRVEPTMIVGQR